MYFGFVYCFLKKLARLFPDWMNQSVFLTVNVYKWFSFFESSPAFDIFIKKINSHVLRFVEWYLIIVLTGISLMASDVEHLLICLFSICIWSGICSIYLAHFLIGLSFFLILKIWGFFKYYVNKKSFVRYMVWNKPSHSIVCLFIFLTRMSWEKNNQFQWVQFIIFFLCESYLFASGLRTLDQDLDPRFFFNIFF